MTHPPLSRVGLGHVSEFRFLTIFLAQQLKARHGSEIHLYCMQQEVKSFYEKQAPPGTFDSITLADVSYETALTPDLDEAAEVARAREFEVRLGETINALSMTDRHLGRGFALAGFRHSRSRYSQLSSYAGMLHFYNVRLQFWDKEFRDKRLTAFISPTREVAAVAHIYSVPTRTIVGSRYQNYYFWARGGHWENPDIQAEWARARHQAIEPVSIDAPYVRDAQHRRRFHSEMRLTALLRRLTLMILRRCGAYLRAHDKARGYYLRELMGEVARRWLHTRCLTSDSMPSLGDLGDAPFIFFPLQEEPELAISQMSPEFFFQQAAIAMLARDLPAGWRLVVKETIHAIGRRPRDFYDQIREFKNVVLIDALELGVDVVKKARAVATISSSAGFEAAVSGKPVIAFGKHNLFNFLPHVMVVERLEDLRGYVRRIVDNDFDATRMAQDGAHYVRAVATTSFDLHGFVTTDPRSASEPAAQNALAALEQSVRESLRADKVAI